MFISNEDHLNIICPKHGKDKQDKHPSKCKILPEQGRNSKILNNLNNSQSDIESKSLGTFLAYKKHWG
jgi:hypothetical protein